jgi:hypothetical protein
MTYKFRKMKFRTIIDIFKFPSMPHVKLPLGRWNSHNYSQTVLKIKYANEDNCGISYSNKLDDDYEYIYMMGYESVCE